MQVDERVLGTIEAIYDAALDETRWPVALKRLADFNGNRNANVVLHRHVRRALTIGFKLGSLGATQPRAIATRKAQGAQRLRSVFGLTEAESRLAMLVADGENLRSAAQKLDIAYGTARARLAEIFQKTDTHRQAELLKLLLGTLAID